MNQYIPAYEADFFQRDPHANVIDLIYQRWSPRAFKKTQIDQETLASIFDAARWAPSCFNEQPWVFLTSTKQTFDQFLSLLVEGNQSWAKNAALLGFILTNKQFNHNGKNNSWATFDAGAAWMAMSLQASSMGLYTHGMGGIKKEQIYQTFNIDKDKLEVICGFALGEIDNPETLSDVLEQREQPSPRKPLAKIWKQDKLQ